MRDNADQESLPISADRASAGVGAHDTTLLRERDVLVTTTRVVVGEATYAMAGVTSVERVHVRPSRTGPALALLGTLLLWTSSGFDSRYVPGVALFGGLAALMAYRRRPRYALVLRTAGGEVRALETRDRAFLTDVALAVTDAIVRRG